MFEFITFQWIVEHFVDALLPLIIVALARKTYVFLCNHTNLFKKNTFDLTFNRFCSIMP